MAPTHDHDLRRLRSVPARGYQRGSTLLVALIFLMVMTMMGLAVAAMSTADERMARNRRDQGLALQAAEAALRDARKDLLVSRGMMGATGATSHCRSTNTSELKGFCLAAPAGQANVWELYLEDASRSVEYGEMTGLTAAQKFRVGAGPGNVSAQPRYMIEAVPDKLVSSIIFPGINWAYRITAIGYGANPGTRVVLQELIRK